MAASKEPLKAAYLIVGDDRAKVRLALTRLRRRVVAESGSDLNVVTLEAGGAEAARLRETLDSPRLTLGRRLVLVLAVDRWAAAERGAAAALLRDLPPDTCVCFEAQKLAKDDPLRKAVAAVGDVLVYDLPRRHEMAGWLVRLARQHGLPLPAATARHFLDVCGAAPEHVERLEREVEKLAAYCRGRAATPDDVDAVCTPSDEMRIFDLTDAIGRRRRADSLRVLETLFAGGDEAPDRVLASLVRHLRHLEAVLLLPPERQGGAAEALGVHPYAARKLLEQREHWDLARVRQGFAVLAEAQAQLRGRAPASLEGSGGVDHGGRLVLELAVARLLAGD